MDREKVIKAWKIFRDSNPYEICSGREFQAIRETEYCMSQMIEDTIALLKGQEGLMLALEQNNAVNEFLNAEVERLTGLLKENDPVKPHYNARTNWYECGACRYSMTSGMHCRGELIPAYRVGFCAKCGKKVKWE